MPHPLLLQILSITEEVISQEEGFYKCFWYENHQAHNFRKLSPFMFRAWYQNAWNLHLGYKIQYRSIGFRLVFTGKPHDETEFLPTYPWADDVLNKYNIKNQDLLIKL